ncbi:hypothetical protein HNP52_002175 [Sphingomonas kyeonggiensis]|uniref:YbjN domain-containing protein n=1 Tax=Sphingomonas kyeonggiensis TaxID=1268553 RepID=A0A7W7K1Q9_9SPHN|nr:YbjN domain-containing protein [Sphingomonas kyeonggiensis]MBB4839106.1 hypothetical protein [Sphingomonas kyeonggiensis]
MRGMLIAAALAAGLSAAPAMAQKGDTARLVDISRPEEVVKLLQSEGYKAELKKHEDSGDPYIGSAANGSPFTIEFYDCSAAKGCTSMQFFSWYKKKPWYDVAMANRWNAKKRFLRIVIDKDGDLSTWMDVTTIGKVSYANFADTIDWWSSMTGDLFTFMDDEEKAFTEKK